MEKAVKSILMALALAAFFAGLSPAKADEFDIGYTINDSSGTTSGDYSFCTGC
jgi:hypothetical protein